MPVGHKGDMLNGVGRTLNSLLSLVLFGGAFPAAAQQACQNLTKLTLPNVTITSATPSNNTLTLQGTVNNNAISGGWTLAGLTPGCTGEGDFTFTRVS